MSNQAILKLIQPKPKDIGEFEVRRALPQIGLRSVGPWVFFDHFGPVQFLPGQGINVRPHPHINLATVSYLFEGEIYHRDSLGNSAPILPGAVNLMIAGRGIVHSERSRDELRATGYALQGLQLWLALPEAFEEVAPEFLHYPAEAIPEIKIGDVTVRQIMGQAYGLSSPVKCLSPTLYSEAQMPKGSTLDLPETEELAIYVASGEVKLANEIIPEFAFAKINLESGVQISASAKSRIAMIGGAPLGPRHMYWNFISSRPERVEQAKRDWLEGRFPLIADDQEDFIPLPD